MDDDARRLKKDWQRQQKAAARAAFPLPDDVLTALFRDVEVRLYELGCDNTPRITRDWLSQHDVDPHSVLAWLEDTGGFCDCEVVANSADHFRTNRT